MSGLGGFVFGGLTGGMSSGCGAMWAGWFAGEVRDRPVLTGVLPAALRRFRARARRAFPACPSRVN
jgi:hypothetical protein